MSSLAEGGNPKHPLSYERPLDPNDLQQNQTFESARIDEMGKVPQVCSFFTVNLQGCRITD